MQHAPAIAERPLGAACLPRRRFLPPAAVRVAQFLLVARFALALGLLASSGLSAPPVVLLLPGFGRVTMPGAATWSALALWILAGAVFETVLVLRLGHLRTGSRRVVLLVEAAVIAISGLYTAAGLEIALVPLVGAISTVVLLRLDHVRQSFDRAGAERRLLGLNIQAVLCEGYAPTDFLGQQEAQRVGYRVVAEEAARGAPVARGMSTS